MIIFFTSQNIFDYVSQIMVKSWFVNFVTFEIHVFEIEIVFYHRF